MQLQLQVTDAVTGDTPTENSVRAWTDAALAKIGHVDGGSVGELTVRVVDENEMASLNVRYRGARGATNVLSFPCDDLPLAVLGDVVICAPLVARESTATGAPPMDYWARMVIHGVLHLCGYDHQDDAQAAQMETLERDIMDDLGIKWCRAF